MAQRYVLNTLNASNLHNMSRMDEPTLSRQSSRKDLNSSMHSLSKTKTPTRLSSKAAKDPCKGVPIEKYEELVFQCNELGKANGLLRMERDQFYKGYHDLKFISEREKAQLCQAFQELKVSYVQMQNKFQMVVQQNVAKRTPASSIDKLSSEIEEGPASGIYTVKEQYYAVLQENKNLKFHIDSIQKELVNARTSLDKALKEKYEIARQLQITDNELKLKLNEGKNKTPQQIRQQLHRQSEQRYVLGLQSQKNLNPQLSKISLLMEQNHNLIIWKQNLQKYYLSEIKKLNQTIQTIVDVNSKQQSQIEDKNSLIGKLEAHLESVTHEHEKVQERSKIAEFEIGKLKAESMEVKQKASEEYKSKIAEILDKAFNLSK